MLCVHTVNLDHGAEIAIVHIPDALFQKIGHLNIGEFTLKWDCHIKNQIGVRRPFYHTEIMNGKTVVKIFCNFFDLCPHFIDFFIIGDDRINMDSGGAVQFILELVLNIVDLIMDDQKVTMSGDFSMK